MRIQINIVILIKNSFLLNKATHFLTKRHEERSGKRVPYQSINKLILNLILLSLTTNVFWFLELDVVKEGKIIPLVIFPSLLISSCWVKDSAREWTLLVALLVKH